MQGLVTIIRGDLEDFVKKIWLELEDSLNIQIPEPKIPHFSWYGAEKFPERELRDNLEKRIKKLRLRIKCGGMAFFPGKDLVIYIPITVSSSLLKLHTDLFNQIIKPLELKTLNLQSYYFPDNWVPHITLIQQKNVPNNISEIMQKIFSFNTTFEIVANNLALVDSGLGKVFEFTY